MDLRREIENSTAHRPIRDKISGYVLANPGDFSTIMEMALDSSDANHHKAWWILELILESQIDWIAPYLEMFCNALSSFTDESALRSISKICLFVCRRQFSSRAQHDFATDDALQKIASAAFDWLIDDRKVATKAYSMRALFLLGTRYDWIYEELNAILSKDFASHSAGYQAAAKQILRAIGRDHSQSTIH